MKYAYLLALLLLAASTSALQFLSPADGVQYTEPASIQFSWDDLNATFTLDGQIQTTTNASYLATLLAGTHLASITNGSIDVNKTVIVLANATNQTNSTQNQSTNQSTNQPTNNTQTQIITVSADKQAYEIGTSARIRITVQQPSQLNLTIQRNNVVVDSYTINVQQQTDFLYTPQAVGNYDVLAIGSGASGTGAFVVQNTTLYAAISSSNTATVGKIISLQAQVSGGTQPYVYQWIFSDNTTSTGSSVDHVFSANGSYSVTLFATDATGKQVSTAKSISVSEKQLRLDVTVMDSQQKLLPKATVTVVDARGGKSAITDSFGEVTFKNLSAGNYSVNVSYNETAVNPPVIHNVTKNIELVSDEDLLFSITLSGSSSTINTTNTSTQSTQNTSNSSNTTTQAAAEPTATALKSAAAESQVTAEQTAAELAAQNQKTAEQLQAEAFEQVRAQKAEELRVIRASISRSEEKLNALKAIGLGTIFDDAQNQIQQAATEDAINKQLSTVPKDVVVISKDTSIQTLAEDDVESLLEEFYTARSIVESSDKKKYEYSIHAILPNITLTTKRTVIRIINQEGAIGSSYTLFTRSMESPEATTFVEFIPKAIAADASLIHVDGSNEVLVADPVIRFLTPNYSYYVEGEPDETEQPRILPVPIQVSEPPSFIGFVSIKFQLNSFERGGFYLILLGALIGIVAVGNIYLRKDSSSTLPAFHELTNITLTSIEQGNYTIASKHRAELEQIHASLSPKEQEQTKDIIIFIQQASAVHTFRKNVEQMHNLLITKDLSATVTAYERVMQSFEELSDEYKNQEKSVLDKLNEALESQVLDHEQTTTAGQTIT